MLFDLQSEFQGIVHGIAPQLGLTQPGQTISCGEKLTSPHEKFGSLTLEIGTGEIEQVWLLRH
jgi:3-isopropylmalate/(R)-2-methylmalate dehydratase large subunit